jgi:hypothetical protein
MNDSVDSFDDIWELAEHSLREARVLRSFLEYLRTWDDPPEKKWERINKWKSEVGIQMGNPQVTDTATELFQKLRSSPPELRRTLVRRALAESDALYLFPER